MKNQRVWQAEALINMVRVLTSLDSRTEYIGPKLTPHAVLPGGLRDLTLGAYSTHSARQEIQKRGG